MGRTSTGAVLRLEIARRQAGLRNLLASTDPAGRLAAIRTLLFSALLIAALGGVATRLSRVSGGEAVLDPVVAALFLVVVLVLVADGARRSARGAASAWERGFYEGWLRGVGVPASTRALLGTIRSSGAALAWGWAAALPLLPLLSLHSRFEQLLLLFLPGASAVLAGDALGQWCRHGSRAARRCLGALALTVSAVLVTVLRAGVPEEASGPLAEGCSRAALRGVGALLSPSWGLAIGLLAFALSLGASFVARWRGEQLVGRPAARLDGPLAPAGLEAMPRRRADWASLALRDVRKLGTWGRREILVALYVFGAIAGFYLLSGRLPEAMRAAMLGPGGLPWLALYGLALPMLALSETLWAGDGRMLWGYYRIVMPRRSAPFLGRGASTMGATLLWVVFLSGSLGVSTGRWNVALRHLEYGATFGIGAVLTCFLPATAALLWSDGRGLLARLQRYLGLSLGAAVPLVILVATGSLLRSLGAALVLSVSSVGLSYWLYRQAQFGIPVPSPAS